MHDSRHRARVRRVSGAVALGVAGPLLVTLAAATASPAFRPDGWLQSRFGPAHNADNRIEQLLSARTVRGLHEKWKVPVSRTNWVLENEPAVMNGVVYLATWDGHLWAVDAATGAVRWSRTLRNGTFGTVPVDGSAMYAWLANGEIHAYALTDGHLLWSVSESNGGGTPDNSSLTLNNGVLYGASWVGDAFARTAATGAQIWRTPVSDSLFGTAVVWRNEALVIDDHSTLHALSASTGAQLWSRRLTFPDWDDPPAVGAGGLAFVIEQEAQSSPCKLAAIDAKTGTIRWETPLGAQCLDAGYVALDATRAYVATDQDELVQVDAASGTILWRTHLSGVAFAGGYWNEPVLANGLLYVAGSTTLWAVDTNSGRVVLAKATAGVFGEPVIWSGAVYTAEADHRLHAYDLGRTIATETPTHAVSVGGTGDPRGITSAVLLQGRARAHG